MAKSSPHKALVCSNSTFLDDQANASQLSSVYAADRSAKSPTRARLNGPSEAALEYADREQVLRGSPSKQGVDRHLSRASLTQQSDGKSDSIMKLKPR